MTRSHFAAAAAVVALVAVAAAQDDIRRGTLKAVDAEKKVVTVTVGGKDVELAVTDQTRVFGADDGKPLADRLATLKVGSEVMFRAVTRGGKEVAVGLRPGEAGQPKQRPTAKADTSKLKPLTELGAEKYQGFEGGLYPGGSNDRPAGHAAAGLAMAKKVRPLGPDGNPAADGKVVLLSVGMSNTTQEFSAFQRLANADAEKNPKLVIVDGAQGGMTAARIKSADDPNGGGRYWATVDQRLKAAGVTRDQVQIAWIKEADAGPTQGFPKYAQTLRDELRQIVKLMRDRFPNLRLVYLSSRIYGGYATTPLNPEPYAYESGFAVKWLVEEHIKGEPDGQWVSWGPYLWANGGTKRADGLTYAESDFAQDGTHPSDAGRKKVAGLLLDFFKSDPTASPWFRK